MQLLTPRSQALFSLLLLAGALLVAPATRSEDKPAKDQPPKAWDQAAVTSLAGQLAKASDALWVAVLNSPNLGQVGSGDGYDSQRLQYKTRRIREQSMALAGALAAGKGKAETFPEVEDLGELADDLQVIFERMFVEQQLKQKLVAARDIWRQLIPYYGIKPRKY